MANELSALVEVAAEAVDRLGVTPVQTMHQAIAERVFRNTGTMAAPVKLVHDGVARATYGALRRAGYGGFGLLAAAVRSLSGDAEVRPLSNSPRGRLAVGGLNGLLGDRLAERGSDLAVGMAVRLRGHDVPCTPDHLRRAFPEAGPRPVVFLHGLAETEEWWLRRRELPGEAVSRPFGERLRDDLGLSPVYLRYNTGLHVSQNGALLAELLESLVAGWPVPVEDLLLVGHSMGGLVVRSACHVAGERGQQWPTRLRKVVTLGTPHHGAPLEKAVHAAAWALRAVPEARAFADILDNRSAGIRDLCFGLLHDDDWREADIRKLLHDGRRDIPLLQGCRHTFITATLTRDAAHPVGRLMGDLLVRTESAGGRHRERHIPVDADCVVHLGGLTHFDLLDHPQVYLVLREALAAATG